MFHLFKYTDGEMKEILESIEIVGDKREQKNQHIFDHFEKKGFASRQRSLDFGDYTVILPANKDLGILRDIWLENLIVIERKNSLMELSGNFTDGRDNFIDEIIRAERAGAMFLLMIENGSWSDILHHRYDTKYGVKSYINTLESLRFKHNVHVAFVDREDAGSFILSVFQSAVKILITKGKL